MRIDILSRAERDLIDGFRFYEKQSLGLGDRFLDALFTEMDDLRSFAGIHAKVFGFHRMISRRFPYAIYYSVHEDAVVVHAVMDCRMDPARARRRLR
jgi:plasmid stabilization system protein ParE